MQEFVQLFHISFDVAWDYICIRSSSSQILRYILRTSLLGTGMWEQLCFLLPCWPMHLWWALLWASPLWLLPAIVSTSSPCSATCGCSALCWPRISFCPNLSEYMEPTASHRRVFMWHKSLLKPLRLLPKTLFFKSKMRKRRKIKQKKRVEEGKIIFSPANAEQQPKLLAAPVKNNRGVSLNLSVLKFCIRGIHHRRRITVGLCNCYRSNTITRTEQIAKYLWINQKASRASPVQTSIHRNM